MKRALQCCLVAVLASACLAATSQPPTPADVQMGEEYAAMAMRSLDVKQPTPSMWAESQALAMAAEKVNPAEPRWPRLVARFAANTGDTPAIIEADKSLLALRPNYSRAQLQLVDIYLAQMETADQKDRYLSSLVDKQSLAPDVRSYAATRLAKVLLERSETKEARDMVGRALNLNPLNMQALEMQYEFLADNGSALEKTTALLGLLRANPAQPDVIWKLARQVSMVGLEKLSAPWYDLAAGSMARSGQPVPEDLLADYAGALYLSGDRISADQLIDKALGDNSSAPQLWMVKAILERDQPDRVKEIVAKANVAAFNVIQKIRTQAGEKNATTRPVDLDEPMAMPDLSDQLHSIAADRSGELRHLYIANVGNWAWLEIYFAHRPDDARPMIDFLSQIVSPQDPLLHRLRGWSDLVKGNTESARAQFVAAGNDPLSQMGLLEIEKKHDSKDFAQKARKLISDNSIGIVGMMLYSQFKGPGVDLIPSNQSQAVEDQLGRFPMQYMSILTSPQGFYAVHIDPLKADYGYDDPILVRISLQNVCGIDLTVGDDGLIHPTVLIDAQQRGVGDKAFGGIAYDYLGASQILHAGDEISQIVRIDQGSFGLMLLNNPEMTLQFTLLATTNAIPTRDRIFIGLGGYRYQMPRIIQRSSAPLSSDTGRQRVMAMLGGDNGGDRIRGIVLLANYAAQYLSDPNSAAEQKKAAADLLGAIAQTLDDSSPCVQAMGAFALARVQSSQKHWDAMTKLADDPNWQKQLLSAFGLQGAPIELQKTVDQKLAAGDHDPIVKKYAAARLASLEKTK